MIQNSSDGLTWSEPEFLPLPFWEHPEFEGFFEPSLLQDPTRKYWIYFRCIDATNDICVMNSTDGRTWSDPMIVIDSGADEDRPEVTVDYSGRYWLVWNSNKVSAQQDIYFSTSSNSVGWNLPIRITTDLSEDTTPSILIDSNGTIWIAWESERDPPDWDVMVTHSTITLTSPLGGEILSGTQNISWVSISGDYLNDSFSLFYSSDTNWILIDVSIPADDAYTSKNYSWDTTNVPDGTYRIKIVRTNSRSGHNETDVSDNFTIDNPLRRW